MDGRGECPVCGSLELLRGDGTIRAHKQLRMRPGGPYRSAMVCPGTGEPPESEPADLVAGGV